MKIINKGITFLFTILISVYCLTPVNAETVNSAYFFYNNIWINQNGYYIQLPPKYLYDAYPSRFSLLNTTVDNNYGNMLGNITQGSIGNNQHTYIDLSGASGYIPKTIISYNYYSNPQRQPYNGWHRLITFEIENSYQERTITYNEDNKQTILKKLIQYDFKYIDNETYFTYYTPYFRIGFSNYQPSSNVRKVDAIDEKDKTYTEYTSSLKYIKFPVYTYSDSYSFNGRLGYTYGIYINPNDLEISYSLGDYMGMADVYSSGNNYLTFTSDDSGNYYHFRTIDTSQYNNSGRKGFKLSLLMLLGNSVNESDYTRLVDQMIFKWQNFDTFYIDGLGESSIMMYDSYGFVNFLKSVISGYENGNPIKLPDIVLKLLNNQGNYYNNKNNYYWWGNLSFDTPDIINPDPEQPENPDPEEPTDPPTDPEQPEQPENPTPDNTTIQYLKHIDETLTLIYNLMENGGGGSSSGGGSGLSAEQYQELISILNSIKDNMKDYSGDLTLINNTLQSINRILSENILNQYDLIYQCLNDVKALSELQNQQLTGISGVLQEMKSLFLDIYTRLGEIKDKIGGTINNIEEGTNLWDVLKALIDNLGEFLSSGLELFEKLLVPQGTFETDFNSTITSIQDKLGVLYQPVDVLSGFLTDLYAPTEVASLSESSHIIAIPEVKYQDVTIIEPQQLNLDETVEQSGLKPLYEVYLLIVDMIVLFGILNLAFKKFHDIISENGGDYK